jgi:hypothetical protein
VARARKSKRSTSQPVRQPEVPPRLLRRRAAAEYLSVSAPYIDALRAQGLLRSVPLPAARGAGDLRIPLFDINDLNALIDKLKTAGGVL